MAGELQRMAELGKQLRVDSIRCTTAAGSGHPTSSMSAADLMAVLLVNHLKYDWDEPGNPNNDRLIFSKGHASPLLYSMYKAAGVITDDELMSLRTFGSRLEGHPKPLQRAEDHGAPRGLPWVDVATGSLGQGLPIGVGMALGGKYVDKLPFDVWVLLGDSEVAEGSVWEAFDKAGHYKLSNVIAILDMNRLGQRGPTDLGWDAPVYAARARAFGWHAIEIDGHDIAAIDAAYKEALAQDEKPTCIVAKTVKGSGVSLVADKEGWHGKALSPDQATAGHRGAGRRAPHHRRCREAPRICSRRPRPRPGRCSCPPTRSERKKRRGKRSGMRWWRSAPTVRTSWSSTAKCRNSTFTEEFNKAYPEQVLRGLHRGAAARRRRPRPGRPGEGRLRGDVRRLPHPCLRPDPHGGRVRRQPSPVRLARRRQHRRGRAVADGPGGPGDDAGRPRQHRAVPVRCQPDGVPGGDHGGPARHLLPANDSREDAGHLPSG